jgi:hypothetical protein
MKKITLALLCFASFTTNAQNVKLEVGKKISIHNKSNIVSVKPDAMGGGETKVETELFATLYIVSKSENSYAATYTGLRMTNKNEDTGNLDSDNKDDRESDRGQMMFKGINMNISKTIDATTGKVTEVEKKNEAEDKTQNDGKATIKVGIKEAGNITDNLFLVISDNKKIGDKWTIEYKEGEIKIIKTYELKSRENAIATIAISTYTNGTTTMETNGMTIERTETTKGNGTMIVDSKTSLVKKIIMNSETEGSIDYGGNSTPISTKRTTVTTFE